MGESFSKVKLRKRFTSFPPTYSVLNSGSSTKTIPDNLSKKRRYINQFFLYIRKGIDFWFRSNESDRVHVKQDICFLDGAEAPSTKKKTSLTTS